MEKIYKYLIVLISVSLLFPVGCSEDFLDEEALTFYSEDNYYNTPEGMDLAVVTLYSNVFDHMIYNYRTSFYESWVLGTDVAEPVPMYFRSGEETMAGYTSDWNAENSDVENVWIKGYAALNSINTILSNIDIPEWESDSQKNRIKGNALFFRAWWYFYLVQAYGDIPLVTEPVAEAKTDFVRDPASEVIAQIIEDLTEAVSALPKINEVVYNGEIGKGAAQHLLANVYLYQESWDEAEQIATDLIESGDYSLMTERFGIEKNNPGTPWTDLFFDGNINRWEGNNETVWALQTADHYLTEGHGQYLKCCWLDNYPKVNGVNYSTEYWQRGKCIFRPTQYYLDLFEQEDDRGSEYAIKTIWCYNDASYIQSQKDAGTPLTQLVDGVEVEVEVGDTVVINDETTLNWLFPQPTKFMDIMEDRAVNECYSDKDIPFMRLAETYLFRAEARFREGDLSGAADDINVLRRRANALEISSSDVDIDLILDERARELMGEVNRRFTLIRTGKLIERNELYNEKSVGNISEKHNLYPIPQVEIDRMINSSGFSQNSGWE